MWFYTALATTVLSAFSIILIKKLLIGVSASVLMWATLLIALPLTFVFALKDGIPEVNHVFFLGILGSVILYTIAKILNFKAIRGTNLSSVYPLISLGPIITLVIAFFPPLSETPSFLAVVGVIVTLLGCYVLNIETKKEGIFKPFQVLLTNRTSLLMLFSIFIGSIVIIFDKIAINNTFPQNTTFALFMEDLFIICGLLPILYSRNKNFPQQIIKNSKLLFLLGVLNATSNILIFSAIGGGNVGLIAALQRTETLFVLLFSFLAFEDKPRRATIIGSLIMIIGVVLIKIGS